MSILIDYAWQKPTPGAIVAAGYAGVLRYLSLDASKNLGPAERDGLLAAGLGIGLVWETTATRAGQGYSAGQQDVQAAEAQANALGYPAGCPIFFAVDYAATVSAVLPYFQGVQSLASHPVGVYGSANIVEGVPVPWKWQTVAWSGGRVSSQAHIYQTLDPSLPGADHNRVLKPVPLWTRTSGLGGIGSGIVTIPGVPNLPDQTTTKPPEDDDMKAFLKVQNDNAVYVSDGITAWHVADEDALKDLVTLCNEGLFNIKQADPNGTGAVQVAGVWVREVGRPELLGQIVASGAPLPSFAPSADENAQAVVSLFAKKIGA